MKTKAYHRPIHRIVLFLFAILIFTILGSIHVSAAPIGNFSVVALIPDNQVDQSQSYFDLRLEKGQEQTVQIEIFNSNAEDIVADIALNAASTARNGLIDYSRSGIRDTSMAISIIDIAKLDDEQITIPASSSRLVDIHLSMPEEDFDGVILGGIVVSAQQLQDSETPAPNDATGIALQNKYAYVLGLKVTQTDTEIAPDFDLTGITPGLVNYHTAVTAHLQNPAPYIVKGMEVTAQVYRESRDKPLYTLALDGADMAPSSTGSFVIDWNSNPLTPGDYRLYMRVDYLDDSWEWDEPFTISAQQAGESNNAAAELVSARPHWPFWLLGVLIATILFLLAFRLGRRSKGKDTPA